MEINGDATASLSKKELKRLKTSRRIWEIDFLRGIAIILMVFDHVMIVICSVFASTWLEGEVDFFVKLASFSKDYIYTAASIKFYTTHGYRYAVTFPWIVGLREVIRPYIVGLFISLCGLSTAFSRSNLKRGLQLAAVALSYSLASYLLDYFLNDSSFFVAFGVLHMLAFCILFWAVLTLIFKDTRRAAGIALVLGCFVLRWLEPTLCALPGVSDDSFWSIFHENLSLHGYSGFFSPGDYFPIVPNIGVFFIGVAVGGFLYKEKKSYLPSLDGKWNKPIGFLGRNTLQIYLGQAVFIPLILGLLTYFIANPGNWY